MSNSPLNGPFWMGELSVDNREAIVARIQQLIDDGLCVIVSQTSYATAEINLLTGVRPSTSMGGLFVLEAPTTVFVVSGKAFMQFVLGIGLARIRIYQKSPSGNPLVWTIASVSQGIEQ